MSGVPGFPLQSVIVGGRTESGHETLFDPGRHPVDRIEIYPESFGLDQAAAVGFDADTHRAPPARQPRAPSAHAPTSRPADRTNDIDDCAAHDPHRVSGRCAAPIDSDEN